MSIRCVGVSKAFGTVRAVHDIHLHCRAGEVVGMLGANGAGKTTLFKLIMGLLRPDTGTIHLQGNGAKKIGGIIEKPSLYGYLSAYENLRVFAKMQGCPHHRAPLEQALQSVGLPLDRTDPVRNFSMGMKQRLGIAIALLNEPSCLVLDEPFSGLDPLGIASLGALIRQLAASNNLAILVASHMVGLLAQTCDTLYIMHNGKIAHGGEPSQLVAQYTKGYEICGHGIAEASALAGYERNLRGNCATVAVPHSGISNLLAALATEGIQLTSCTPQLDLDQLFNTSR